ncbi:restriction endonuclease [Dickeya fangzhongdai]|uniref:restriction endonuclease n=1 Tax=Dickeya fangzhongdai TaxID=1778540 RepID=UPI0026DFA175|nr:restriction endonuclease [Dickeya fangzhongdai]WKV52752.1 restriction endonuclease [Dickeya fangzhongdai]
MQIEVATESSDTTKQKGDLFEGLIKDLLSAQNYEVAQELRVTGAELDLLCKHKVNAKEIYVECKAQKEKISAPILNKLMGVVDLHDYSEGWIISTSEFGKDALGIVEIISKKPKEKSSKFSFYTPQRVINSLTAAGVIKNPPTDKAIEFIGSEDNLGSWTLLISKFGRFWAVYTLKGGIPEGVLLFNANSGNLVNDGATLENIAKLEATIADYDLSVGKKDDDISVLPDKTEGVTNVVEVQIGDSWDDYRPARPKDFVGRDDMQKEILGFLANVKDGKTNTRIFAITGNSGLGKSSLIAKIRDRSKNKHYHKKYFVYAVDIRGAKSPSYITSALLQALKLAQTNGFGKKIDLSLTDPTSHFSSESIAEYLESIKTEDKVICIIFDQFEELYSKPELFSVFNSANSLMLEVAGYKGNLTLGFAWKTDSTTQQDHPAYHMWHNLSDLRKEFKLSLFDGGEISKSITTFEKEFDHKLTPAIRSQITYSCQGFPWLLKKLCINLRENIKRAGNNEVTTVELDVEKLFTNDLDLLTPSEKTCLDLIASKAPADWSEIIELSSAADVSNLVNKRMVIKSGDRLNIYWDIFKDYLVTKKLPVIPYNYVPTSDYRTIVNIANELENKNYLSSHEISQKAGIKETTMLNIGADLVMFNIAERNGSSFKLHASILSRSEDEFLKKIRERLGKHSFKIELYKKYFGKVIDIDTLIEVLKESLPKAHHSQPTWGVYARRLSRYLHMAGYISQQKDIYIVQDKGTIQQAVASWQKRSKGHKSEVFAPNASPLLVHECYKLIQQGNNYEQIQSLGCKNALTVLVRFNLISIIKKKIHIDHKLVSKYNSPLEAIWENAHNEKCMQTCIEKINDEPKIDNISLASYIAKKHGANWSDSSLKRFGNSLKQWSTWLNAREPSSDIPTPPGRRVHK